MTQQRNKEFVTRLNKEYIEGGDVAVVHELFASDFVNHTAPPGSPQGPEGVIFFFDHMLKPAFPDLKVVIHDQVAEDDKVTTRKSFYATHKGDFFGVPASNKPVVMDIIDILQVKDGKFTNHWGILDMPGLMAQIAG